MSHIKTKTESNIKQSDTDEKQTQNPEKRLELLTAQQEKLERDAAMWRKARNRAVEMGRDEDFLAKIDNKIRGVVIEINDLEGEIGAIHDEIADQYERNETDAAEGDADAIERELEKLENEKIALDQKITELTARLHAIRPPNDSSDYHNDPAMLTSTQDDEDDFETLMAHMAERRRQCQAAGEYNGLTKPLKRD